MDDQRDARWLQGGYDCPSPCHRVARVIVALLEGAP